MNDRLLPTTATLPLSPTASMAQHWLTTGSAAHKSANTGFGLTTGVANSSGLYAAASGLYAQYGGDGFYLFSI